MSDHPDQIVVVDDERTFKTTRSVLYLRSSKDALAFLARRWSQQRTWNGSPVVDELWLDHDLGQIDGLVGPASDIQDDTRPVVQFLTCVYDLGAPFEVGQIYVHSQNPVGARNLCNQLEWANYKVRQSALPELI